MPPLPLADDDVDAVVAHVQRLSAALNAIAQDGHGLVAEHLLEPFRRIIRPLDDRFDRTADLDLSHESRSLLFTSKIWPRRRSARTLLRSVANRRHSSTTSSSFAMATMSERSTRSRLRFRLTPVVLDSTI